MIQHSSIRTSRGLQKLRLLRTFEGSVEHFWKSFLESISDLVGADIGLIMEMTSGDNPFKLIATYSANNSIDTTRAMHKMATEIITKCSEKKVTVFSTPSFSVLALPLLNESSVSTKYVFLNLASTNSMEISAASIALTSVADIPMNYQQQRKAIEVVKQREQIMNILDCNVQLNSQNRFLSAAMLLCNELVSAYKCTRVSLGWRQGSHIRIMGMSQTDHFEKKMEIVRQIEAAMEEAAEQNTEIHFPVVDNDVSMYVRDHENYLKAASVDVLLSIPVRHNNEVVGVCLLEKSGERFNDTDIQHIRMLIDQVSARLDDLYLRDRWVGIHLADWFREKVAFLFGFEHTWVKLSVVIIVAALLVTLTLPVRYRVSSAMILKTDDITFLAAPFDGYIAAVYAKAGESVDKGHVVLSLDKKDLVLEEAGLEAEQTKIRREEDKYRADKRLAEMRISQSQSDQVHTRLDIVQLRLAQADIKAPFSGIIIEGDQHERIGSPVRQGEVLFKLGRIEDIRVEANVSENEIQNIMVGATGQIALASRPNDLFDITVQRIEPAAVSGATGNIFQIMCSFNKDVPQWFRPGMTGISKIDAGRKTIFWIISHQTFDFLWLKLWW